MATIGSLGDLHPALALALELKRRGHLVTVASTGFYRDKVESLGLAFRSLRPNWDPTDQNLIAQCEDLKSGPEVLSIRIACDAIEAVLNSDRRVASQEDRLPGANLVA